VQHIFEEKLTGGILQCARRNIIDAEQSISAINRLLLIVTEGSDKQ